MGEEETVEPERIRKGLTGWFETRWKDATEIELSEPKKPVAVGHSNETFFFDVQWKDNGELKKQAMAARLGITSGLQVFPTYDLAMQYRIVEILGKTDVPVPRLYGYEKDDSILGAPFYLMERIEGRGFVEYPPYHIEGWLYECTPEERTKVWKSGIEALAKIHKLDWKAHGFEFLNRPELGDTPLDQELNFFQEYYDWVRKGRIHPLCEEAKAWLDANKPPQPEPIGFVWTDARLANMLFRGTECVGVFDWERAHLGNPVDDIAWYVMSDRCASEGVEIPRLTGLLSRDETIAFWEEASGMKADNFDYYEFLGYYRLSVIIYQIISMQKEAGLWPADSDFDIWNLASNVLEKEMARRR